MAFEGLSDRLEAAFKRLRSKGNLTESDVKEAMREVRLALLEADVNYKVAKDFTNKVTERAIGSHVLESLTPAQMVIKIVNEELTELMGGTGSKPRADFFWQAKRPLTRSGQRPQLVEKVRAVQVFSARTRQYRRYARSRAWHLLDRWAAWDRQYDAKQAAKPWARPTGIARKQPGYLPPKVGKRRQSTGMGGGRPASSAASRLRSP